MALPNSATLGSLPIVILQEICEYIDDDIEERRSLWAFSSTSRYCYAAAAAQRLCQIQLKIPSKDVLISSLERWNAILSLGDCYRHVRRLKVLHISSKEAEPENARDDDDWSIRYHFGIHPFCRPSTLSIHAPIGSGTMHNSGDWTPLVQFIHQLPALQDFVWAADCPLSPALLSAIQDGGCRLHIHRFCLHSLLQFRGNPQPINSYEYAVVTSPSLYSIVVKCKPFDDFGLLDYTEDAVMQMVAGMAPNLTHVWSMQVHVGQSLLHDQAVRLGLPAWGGFFPGTARPNPPPKRGNLQSLIFTGYEPRRFHEWCEATDMTKLRRLVIPWNVSQGIVWADMAQRGEFKLLDTLEVSDVDDESKESHEALHRLVTNVNPLRRLYLSGYIREDRFHNLLQKHGNTLRELTVNVNPCLHVEWETRAVVFTEAVVRQLVEQCPNLEQIQLRINRTRGDAEETGIYRALSRLPRLRRACLRLEFSIVPEEDEWDSETEGEYPFYNITSEEIPSVYLSQAFSNIALDATLARSIFKMIASGSSLTYLRLQPAWKSGAGSIALAHCNFINTLRWFCRSWICRRDVHGGVQTCELDKTSTTEGGEEWKYLSENPDLPEAQAFTEVFHKLWPSQTTEWWNDWKSLPLAEE